MILIRLPNVFTTPSDILAGYFSAFEALSMKAEMIQLAALMVSSGLLYIAGIVLNDYFDIAIDKKERPFRPLPSGNIPRKNAIIIVLSAIAVANAIAFTIGPASLAVSLALTAIIFGYNYWLKHNAAGPFAMGAARFLNMILGASPAISAILFLDGHVVVGGGVGGGGDSATIMQFQTAIFAAASLFAYVTAITMLSKNEIGNNDEEKTILTAILIVFALIVLIVVLGLIMGLQLIFLLNLSLFAVVMLITLKPYVVLDNISRKKKSIDHDVPSIQKIIRNMVISIIILDSVFVSGTAGLIYGLITLVLIGPTIILAKKIYMT